MKVSNAVILVNGKLYNIVQMKGEEIFHKPLKMTLFKLDFFLCVFHVLIAFPVFSTVLIQAKLFVLV